MSELIPQLSAAIIWTFNALIAIGTINHSTMCFVDVLLVGLGAALVSSRSMARGAGRYYSKVTSKVRGLKKR